MLTNFLSDFLCVFQYFSTAGRTVKTGLTASVIVSQWTWAATLLQSSNVAWQYGVSGPFWYASGATIQVLLFGVLAISLKKVAPSAHTGKLMYSESCCRDPNRKMFTNLPLLLDQFAKSSRHDGDSQRTSLSLSSASLPTSLLHLCFC